MLREPRERTILVLRALRRARVDDDLVGRDTRDHARPFCDDDGARIASHLVFETRRPERRAWEDWAVDTGPTARDAPGIGHVEQRREATEVDPPYVSFRYTYTFASDGSVLTSDSTLRFRSRAEIEESLTANGFTTLDVREAADRPGQEYVFVALRV